MYSIYSKGVAVVLPSVAVRGQMPTDDCWVGIVLAETLASFGSHDDIDMRNRVLICC